nr:hypothetical protein Iba_chr11aCG2550 [Ipomoea batatas]
MILGLIIVPHISYVDLGNIRTYFSSGCINNIDLYQRGIGTARKGWPLARVKLNFSSMSKSIGAIPSSSCQSNEFNKDPKITGTILIAKGMPGHTLLPAPNEPPNSSASPPLPIQPCSWKVFIANVEKIIQHITVILCSQCASRLSFINQTAKNLQQLGETDGDAPPHALRIKHSQNREKIHQVSLPGLRHRLTDQISHLQSFVGIGARQILGEDSVGQQIQGCRERRLPDIHRFPLRATFPAKINEISDLASPRLPVSVQPAVGENAGV